MNIRLLIVALLTLTWFLNCAGPSTPPGGENPTSEVTAKQHADGGWTDQSPDEFTDNKPNETPGPDAANHDTKGNHNKPDLPGASEGNVDSAIRETSLPETSVQEQMPGNEHASKKYPPHTFTTSEKKAAQTALENQSKAVFSKSFEPDKLYKQFNAFALTHFGTIEHPLVRQNMGNQLTLNAKGFWLYPSVYSASIGFATNLPAKAFIEYGLSPKLGSKTAIQERYFYRHLHHLKGLKDNTRYHYRLVAYDERGHTVYSSIKSFTTRSKSGVVEIPGSMGNPPYKLNKANTYYLLTKALKVNRTAFEVSGNNITLDLGGHQVIYSALSRSGISNANASTAQTGVYAKGSGSKGLRIYNGFLKEGYVGNKASTKSFGLHSIYIHSYSDIEIAGVHMSYHGAQVYGVFTTSISGSADVHHNIWIDKGWEILNRHGAGGSRCMLMQGGAKANTFTIRFNLVKRTRHTCFQNASKINDNEIYGDSWATNGFLISPHSKLGVNGGENARNKVFLTGYHGIAFGWAHQGLRIHDNLIHMENIGTQKRRWYESYGDWDSLNGFRITNYGNGGQLRKDLRYENNLMIGRGRSRGMIRGTEFYTDRTITNVVTQGGIFQVTAEDQNTLDIAPIVTQGSTKNRRQAQPMYYRKLLIRSNVANIRFGDSYGKGDNHRFEQCTFEKVGNHSNYHTFVFDGRYDSKQHVILDPIFKGGARHNDVWWRDTGAHSSYSIAWTLQTKGSASATVSIKDKHGKQVYSGKLDANGKLSVPLTMSHIHPVEYKPGAGSGAVKQKTKHQEIFDTPHEITVGGKKRTISMKSKQSITF